MANKSQFIPDYEPKTMTLDDGSVVDSSTIGIVKGDKPFTPEIVPVNPNPGFPDYTDRSKHKWCLYCGYDNKPYADDVSCVQCEMENANGGQPQFLNMPCQQQINKWERKRYENL